MWTWPWSRPAAPRAPTREEVESACSFCDKPRAKVDKLIAGPRASICDACARLAVDVAAAVQGPPRTLKDVVREAVNALPDDAPHQVSTPLLAAAETLATSLAERHNLSLEAFRVRNSPAALRLLDVPDATPTMILNASTCWIAAGRPDEALRRLRALDTAELPPSDQAQHRLNLAAALLLATPPDLAAIEAVLAEGEARLDVAKDSRHAKGWGSCLHNSRGDIALHRQEWAEAERRYRAALETASEDASTWRRLGDVLAATGRPDEARAAREEGRRLAHPETSIAEVLRGRLAR